MDISKLTAQYICENEDRLEMALHVYEAMETVRNTLIERIFKAAGDLINKELDNIVMHCREQDVYFWTEETGEFGVYASAYSRPRRGRPRDIRSFVAGVYADDAKPMKAKQDDIRARFKETVDWGTWTLVEDYSSDLEVSYAFSHQEHGGRWNEGNFLRGAIRHRKELEEAVAELLLRIYRGMCPGVSN